MAIDEIRMQELLNASKGAGGLVSEPTEPGLGETLKTKVIKTVGAGPGGTSTPRLSDEDIMGAVLQQRPTGQQATGLVSGVPYDKGLLSDIGGGMVEGVGQWAGGWTKTLDDIAGAISKVSGMEKTKVFESATNALTPDDMNDPPSFIRKLSRALGMAPVMIGEAMVGIGLVGKAFRAAKIPQYIRWGKGAKGVTEAVPRLLQGGKVAEGAMGVKKAAELGYNTANLAAPTFMAGMGGARTALDPNATTSDILKATGEGALMGTALEALHPLGKIGRSLGTGSIFAAPEALAGCGQEALVQGLVGGGLGLLGKGHKRGGLKTAAEMELESIEKPKTAAQKVINAKKVVTPTAGDLGTMPYEKLLAPETTEPTILANIAKEKSLRDELQIKEWSEWGDRQHDNLVDLFTTKKQMKLGNVMRELRTNKDVAESTLEKLVDEGVIVREGDVWKIIGEKKGAETGGKGTGTKPNDTADAAVADTETYVKADPQLLKEGEPISWMNAAGKRSKGIVGKIEADGVTVLYGIRNQLPKKFAWEKLEVPSGQKTETPGEPGKPKSLEDTIVAGAEGKEKTQAPAETGKGKGKSTPTGEWNLVSEKAELTESPKGQAADGSTSPGEKVISVMVRSKDGTTSKLTLTVKEGVGKDGKPANLAIWRHARHEGKDKAGNTVYLEQDPNAKTTNPAEPLTNGFNVANKLLGKEGQKAVHQALASTPFADITADLATNAIKGKLAPVKIDGAPKEAPSKRTEADAKDKTRKSIEAELHAVKTGKSTVSQILGTDGKVDEAKKAAWIASTEEALAKLKANIKGMRKSATEAEKKAAGKGKVPTESVETIDNELRVAQERGSAILQEIKETSEGTKIPPAIMGADGQIDKAKLPQWLAEKQAEALKFQTDVTEIIRRRDAAVTAASKEKAKGKAQAPSEEIGGEDVLDLVRKANEAERVLKAAEAERSKNALVITREDRNKLIELGYSAEDVLDMPNEQKVSAIRNSVKKGDPIPADTGEATLNALRAKADALKDIAAKAKALAVASKAAGNSEATSDPSKTISMADIIAKGAEEPPKAGGTGGVTLGIGVDVGLMLDMFRDFKLGVEKLFKTGKKPTREDVQKASRVYAGLEKAVDQLDAQNHRLRGSNFLALDPEMRENFKHELSGLLDQVRPKLTDVKYYELKKKLDSINYIDSNSTWQLEESAQYLHAILRNLAREVDGEIAKVEKDMLAKPRALVSIDERSTYKDQRKTSAMQNARESMRVAKANGEDVGYIWYEKVPDGFKVHRIETDPNYRGRKVASQLMADAEFDLGSYMGPAGDMTTDGLGFFRNYLRDRQRPGGGGVLDKARKTQLPKNSYVVFGSGPMEVAGIRSSKDADLLVDHKTFQNMAANVDNQSAKGWKYTPDKSGITNGEVTLYTDFNTGAYKTSFEKIMKNATMVDGIPVASLADVKEWKKSYGRSKDKEDITLIDQSQKRESSRGGVVLGIGLGETDKLIANGVRDIKKLYDKIKGKNATDVTAREYDRLESAITNADSEVYTWQKGTHRFRGDESLNRSHMARKDFRDEMREMLPTIETFVKEYTLARKDGTDTLRSKDLRRVKELLDTDLENPNKSVEDLELAATYMDSWLQDRRRIVANAVRSSVFGYDKSKDVKGEVKKGAKTLKGFINKPVEYDVVELSTELLPDKIKVGDSYPIETPEGIRTATIMMVGPDFSRVKVQRLTKGQAAPKAEPLKSMEGELAKTPVEEKSLLDTISASQAKELFPGQKSLVDTIKEGKKLSPEAAEELAKRASREEKEIRRKINQVDKGIIPLSELEKLESEGVGVEPGISPRPASELSGVSDKRWREDAPQRFDTKKTQELVESGQESVMEILKKVKTAEDAEEVGNLFDVNDAANTLEMIVNTNKAMRTVPIDKGKQNRVTKTMGLWKAAVDSYVTLADGEPYGTVHPMEYLKKRLSVKAERGTREKKGPSPVDAAALARQAELEVRVTPTDYIVHLIEKLGQGGRVWAAEDGLISKFNNYFPELVSKDGWAEALKLLEDRGEVRLIHPRSKITGQLSDDVLIQKVIPEGQEGAKPINEANMRSMATAISEGAAETQQPIAEKNLLRMAEENSNLDPTELFKQQYKNITGRTLDPNDWRKTINKDLGVTELSELPLPREPVSSLDFEAMVEPHMELINANPVLRNQISGLLNQLAIERPKLAAKQEILNEQHKKWAQKKADIDRQEARFNKKEQELKAKKEANIQGWEQEMANFIEARERDRIAYKTRGGVDALEEDIGGLRREGRSLAYSIDTTIEALKYTVASLPKLEEMWRGLPKRIKELEAQAGAPLTEAQKAELYSLGVMKKAGVEVDADPYGFNREPVQEPTALPPITSPEAKSSAYNKFVSFFSRPKKLRKGDLPLDPTKGKPMGADDFSKRQLEPVDRIPAKGETLYLGHIAIGEPLDLPATQRKGLKDVSIFLTRSADGNTAYVELVDQRFPKIPFLPGTAEWNLEYERAKRSDPLRAKDMDLMKQFLSKNDNLELLDEMGVLKEFASQDPETATKELAKWKAAFNTIEKDLRAPMDVAENADGTPKYTKEQKVKAEELYRDKLTYWVNYWEGKAKQAFYLVDETRGRLGKEIGEKVSGREDFGATGKTDWQLDLMKYKRLLDTKFGKVWAALARQKAGDPGGVGSVIGKATIDKQPDGSWSFKDFEVDQTIAEPALKTLVLDRVSNNFFRSELHMRKHPLSDPFSEQWLELQQRGQAKEVKPGVIEFTNPVQGEARRSLRPDGTQGPEADLPMYDRSPSRYELTMEEGWEPGQDPRQKVFDSNLMNFKQIRAEITRFLEANPEMFPELQSLKAEIEAEFPVEYRRDSQTGGVSRVGQVGKSEGLPSFTGRTDITTTEGQGVRLGPLSPEVRATQQAYNKATMENIGKLEKAIGYERLRDESHRRVSEHAEETMGDSRSQFIQKIEDDPTVPDNIKKTIRKNYDEYIEDSMTEALHTRRRMGIDRELDVDKLREGWRASGEGDANLYSDKIKSDVDAIESVPNTKEGETRRKGLEKRLVRELDERGVAATPETALEMGKAYAAEYEAYRRQQITLAGLERRGEPDINSPEWIRKYESASPEEKQMMAKRRTNLVKKIDTAVSSPKAGEPGTTSGKWGPNVVRTIGTEISGPIVGEIPLTRKQKDRVLSIGKKNGLKPWELTQAEESALNKYKGTIEEKVAAYRKELVESARGGVIGQTYTTGPRGGVTIEKKAAPLKPEMQPIQADAFDLIEHRVIKLDTLTNELVSKRTEALGTGDAVRAKIQEEAGKLSDLLVALGVESSPDTAIFKAKNWLESNKASKIRKDPRYVQLNSGIDTTQLKELLTDSSKATKWLVDKVGALPGAKRIARRIGGIPSADRWERYGKSEKEYYEKLDKAASIDAKTDKTEFVPDAVWDSMDPENKLSVTDLLGALYKSSNIALRRVGTLGVLAELKKYKNRKWITSWMEKMDRLAEASGRGLEKAWEDAKYVVEGTKKDEKHPAILEMADLVRKTTEDIYKTNPSIKAREIFKEDNYWPHKVSLPDLYSKWRNLTMMDPENPKLPKFIKNLIKSEEWHRIAGIVQENTTWETLEPQERSMIKANLFKQIGAVTRWEDLPADVREALPKKTWSSHALERNAPEDWAPSMPARYSMVEYLLSTNHMVVMDAFLAHTRPIASKYPNRNQAGTVGWLLDKYIKDMMGGYSTTDKKIDAMMAEVKATLGPKITELIQKSGQAELAKKLGVDQMGEALTQPGLASNLAGEFKSGATAGYLGGNVGSTLANATQMLHNFVENGNMPILRAFKAVVATEYPRMAKAMNIKMPASVPKEWEQAWKLYEASGQGGKKGMGALGSTADLDTYDSMGRLKSMSEADKTAWSTAMEIKDKARGWVLTPFAFVENFNKGLTILGALDAGIKKGNTFRESMYDGFGKLSSQVPDTGLGAGVFDAYMNSMGAQYGAGRAHKSPLLAGPFASVSSLFTTYPLKTAQWARGNLVDSLFQGDYSKFARSVAYLGFQAGAVTLLASAGIDMATVFGKGILPGKRDKGLEGLMPLSWQVVKDAYDIAAKDIGIDRSIPEAQHRQAADDMREILVNYSLPGYTGGIKRSMNSIQNIMRGMRVDKKGVPIGPTSPMQEFLAWVGLKPQEFAEKYELMKEAQEETDIYRANKLDLMDEAMRVVDSGHIEKIPDILKKARENKIDLTVKEILDKKKTRELGTSLANKLKGLPKPVQQKLLERFKELDKQGVTLAAAGLNAAAGSKSFWSSGSASTEPSLMVLDALEQAFAE